MASRSMRFVAIGMMIALFVVGTTVERLRVSPRAVAAEAKDSKLKPLLEKRLAVMRSIEATAREEFRIARGSNRQVFEATKAVRNAELDLCETKQERIAILEKLLADVKGYEAIVEAQRQAAKVSASDVLRATAERLEVEIALERAKGQ